MGIIVHNIMKASAVSAGRNSAILFEVCTSRMVHTIIANNKEIFENNEIEYVFRVTTSLIVKGTALTALIHAPIEIKI
jgi:hypothetical protein